MCRAWGSGSESGLMASSDERCERLVAFRPRPWFYLYVRWAVVQTLDGLATASAQEGDVPFRSSFVGKRPKAARGNG